jgi:hypothetical protein
MTRHTAGGFIGGALALALCQVFALEAIPHNGVLATALVVVFGVIAAFGATVLICAFLASLPWGRRRHWSHRFKFLGQVYGRQELEGDLGTLTLRSNHAHIVRDVHCVLKLRDGTEFIANAIGPNGLSRDEYHLIHDWELVCSYPTSFEGLSLDEETAYVRWIAHTQTGREVLLWKGTVNFTGP